DERAGQRLSLYGAAAGRGRDLSKAELRRLSHVMRSLHGAQLARRIVSEEGAGRIVGTRPGHFHLRLLRTNRQGDVSRGRLFALGAISVCQRLTRGGMESLRSDVADRARGPASAGFHLGPKGRLQARLGKLASCGSWRNRKL